MGSDRCERAHERGGPADITAEEVAAARARASGVALVRTGKQYSTGGVVASAVTSKAADAAEATTRCASITAIAQPTVASAPHSIVNGMKNLLAIAAVTDITFKVSFV